MNLAKSTLGVNQERLMVVRALTKYSSTCNCSSKVKSALLSRGNLVSKVSKACTYRAIELALNFRIKWKLVRYNNPLLKSVLKGHRLGERNVVDVLSTSPSEYRSVIMALVCFRSIRRAM